MIQLLGRNRRLPTLPHRQALPRPNDTRPVPGNLHLRNPCSPERFAPMRPIGRTIHDPTITTIHKISRFRHIVPHPFNQKSDAFHQQGVAIFCGTVTPAVIDGNPSALELISMLVASKPTCSYQLYPHPGHFVTPRMPTPSQRHIGNLASSERPRPCGRGVLNGEGG